MSAARSVPATFILMQRRSPLTTPFPYTTLCRSTSNDGLVNCPGTCTATYNSGASVTLTAAAASGSTFGGWGGSCRGTVTTCAATRSAAPSVTATFNAATQQFTLTVNAAGARGSG